MNKSSLAVNREVSDPPALPPQRERFHLPSDLAYLNCANMSPQLRSVTEAGGRAVRQKASPWVIESGDWFASAEDLRGAAAALMGTVADNIALVPAVSYGIALAAANLPLERGQNVVILAEQFPSNVYAWREATRAVGAELRTVRRDPDDDWSAAVLAGIDENTAVVAVPGCHWTDGTRVDLVAAGERARSVGAALVVDASQSFGASPIPVAEIQPDFLVSVGYKWQLGPYGLGYLYVSRKWCEAGRPLESSWLTRSGAEDFASLVEYVDDYRSGARRFDMGEYPQFVLAPMALAALRQLQAWTVEAVARTIGRLTRLIASKADGFGYRVLPAARRADHMLGIRAAGGLPAGLLNRLRERRIYVSVRGDAIRVSPHVYNDAADVWRLIEVLEEFA